MVMALVMAACGLLAAWPALAKPVKTSPSVAASGKGQAAKKGKTARVAPSATAGPRVKAGKVTARTGGKPALAGRAAVKGTGAVQGSKIQGPGIRLAKRNGKRSLVRIEPPRPSFGEMYGLRATDDELDLRSSVALVIDQDTDEVLFSKNPQAVLPIASITKLMTALVVTQAALPMDELLTVGQDDVQATSGTRSRLREGTQLTRGEMMHLSLMASENRAAHVLGRTYPGGLQKFVSDMNGTARKLGMIHTRYVEPTGLSELNQSSAQDLTRLVKVASLNPLIRELSTSLEMMVPMGAKSVQFRNTNGLVRNPEWEIGLQKTGYIAAAGRCVVMQAQLAGRKLIMVLLDSTGKYSRMGDAERLRHWLVGAEAAASVLQTR
jgi:D-alanyl-D-alanine endopeptidase (penicillin-binding protein 7)